MDDVRTWIEINLKELSHNVGEFLRIIPKRTQFMAVVKSNAYGHGLVQVAKQLAELGIRNKELGGGIHNSKFAIHNSMLWFGVDSIVEGLRLRREGIKNPTLVLGATLPARLSDARESAIILTISNFDALRALSHLKEPPDFHIKIDTGMHRQGFLSKDILALLKMLKHSHLNPAGIYTHFAAAKDVAYPTYTKMQLAEFEKAVAAFHRAGFKNIVRHATASGGTLLFPETHLDMVRIGMGMYGYWPSEESRIKNQESRFLLKPVLIWKTVITEIKEIPAGSAVGYDLTERVSRKTKIAVLPIGYWHGYDRGLSSVGEVLIRGKRVKVLGRVSMDMTVIDVTDVPWVKDGDEVVLIGKQKKGREDASAIASTSENVSKKPSKFLCRFQRNKNCS